MVLNGEVNTGCGNCSYGCCCSCKNEKCYLCSYNRGKACRSLETYREERYPDHYICWDCKRTWKVSFFDRRSIETKRKDVYSRNGYTYSLCRYTPRCGSCGKPGDQMPLSFRPPKLNDKNGWILIKKMHDREGLIAKHENLASDWSFCHMFHQSDEYRNKVWLPKKLSEYDDWIEFMNNTKSVYDRGLGSKRSKKRERRKKEKEEKKGEKEKKKQDIINKYNPPKPKPTK